MVNPKTSAKSQNLKDSTFVFTGTMGKLSRDDAEQLTREHGGKASSSVSKKTDYVVAGENPGSKYEEAKKLGVKIINEEEFLKLVD